MVVLSAVGTPLALIPAVLVGNIINGPIIDGDKDELASQSLQLLGYAAGGFLAMWFGGRVLAVAAQDAMYRLRKEVFEHTQTLSLRFFDRQPIGDLMSRITNDLDSVGQLFDKGLSPAINSAFTLVITTILMFIVSWQLALVVMLIAPLVVVMMRVTSGQSGPAFAVLQERTGALNGTAEELITGDRTVKAYRVEEHAIAKLEQLSEEARVAGQKANFVALTAMPLSALLSNLDVALVALAGGWLSLRGTVDVGTVASFFIFARMFARPLNQFAQILNMALQAGAGATRVFEILDEKAEIVDREGAREVTTVEGHVVMDHVDFSYVPGVPILHDVTLAAKPGQKIGLVGPTGAGKSTIINVITRYYDIQAGDIRLDDTSIYDAQTESLRKVVGMVLQEPYLFSDTVMANIRYARLEATDEECIEAAKTASADGFITRLPEGYDTVLNGGGLEPQPGPAAADHDRPHHPRQPPRADPRRGHLQRRHPHRAEAPGGADDDDEGPHELRDRAPPVHDPRCGRHRRDQRGACRRRRQPRRAHGREGLLPRPVHEPVPRRREVRRRPCRATPPSRRRLTRAERRPGL